MVSVSGIDIKFGRIAIIFGLLVGGTYFYIHYGSTSIAAVHGVDNSEATDPRVVPGNSNNNRPQINGAGESGDTVMQSDLWELSMDSNKCTVKHLENKVTDANNRVHVLLLHGANFNETTWETIGTMKKLADEGYSATAVNLKKCTGDHNISGVAVMKQIVAKLNTVNKLVIVSPSKSGSIALPYIVSNGSRADGLVAVAPVVPTKSAELKTEDEDKYKALKLKILWVQGEKDKSPFLTTSKNLLQNSTNFEEKIIPGAGHACYQDKPEEWHKILIEFIKSLLV